MSNRHNDEVAILKDCLLRFIALAGFYSDEAVKEVSEYLTGMQNDVQCEADETAFLNATVDFLKSILADKECEARETAEYRSVLKDWTEIDTSNEDMPVSIGVGIAYDFE